MKNQHSTSPFPVPSSFNTRILCLGNCCLCFSIRLKVSSHPSPILLEEMAKCWNPRLVSGFLLTLNAHTSLLISPSPQIALPTRLIYLYSLSCSWSANDPHSTVKEKNKNKKIYSLQISFYELTSQLLWKSCQFPYNLLFSSASRLRFCWRFQGWDALCVKVMALEWQLLLPMTLIRETLSW